MIYFSCAHATVFDLKITSSFQIQHNTSIHFRYWLSSKGKPEHDLVSLKEISGAVTMNGRLTEGEKCCLKECEK